MNEWHQQIKKCGLNGTGTIQLHHKPVTEFENIYLSVPYEPIKKEDDGTWKSQWTNSTNLKHVLYDPN
jgi:hypothetical protein